MSASNVNPESMVSEGEVASLPVEKVVPEGEVSSMHHEKFVSEGEVSSMKSEAEILDEQTRQKKEDVYRKSKTLYLLCVFVCFGISTSLTGPAIPDLSTRLCVTLSQFSISISVGALGSLIGSMTFGLLIDRFQRYADLLLGVTLCVVATAMMLKPFIPWLWLFIVITFFEALGFSGTDAGSNCMLFGLWGANVDGPLHALHLSWGVGATIAPFVVRPFLGSDKNETDIGSECVDDSEIQNPYIIGSCLMYLMGAIAIAFYLIGPPKGMAIHARPIKSVKQVFDVKSIGGGDLKFGITILVLFALFYFGNAGREHVFSTWLFTYAIESDLDFTKQEAALLDAANKASFMIGRIIATPISHFAPIQPMLFVEIYTVMVLVTGLATLGTTTKTYLWVFSCLMNAVSAPIWPGGLTWTDKYVPVTAIILTVMTLGSASAGFFFQWFTGWLFTYKSPDDVMYLLVGCSALLCVLMVIMQVVASKKGNRYTRVAPLTIDMGEKGEVPEDNDNNDNNDNNENRAIENNNNINNSQIDVQKKTGPRITIYESTSTLQEDTN